MNSYINIDSCVTEYQPSDALIKKNITIRFLENDSIIANCINEYNANYLITKHGEIKIINWAGTKEYETDWGKRFNTSFPKVNNYYTIDTLLLMFTTNNEKIKFIKIK